MLLLQGRAEPEKEKTIQKGSKETQKGEQAQEGKTGHEGKTRQKGPEMQQGQQEAFLAKFRNWAGKPLGQNFAPQGEGKKKKKKKKKKVAEGHFFFSFSFSSSSPLWVPKKKFPHCVQLPMKLPPAPPEEGTSAPQIRNPNP